MACKLFVLFFLTVFFTVTMNISDENDTFSKPIELFTHVMQILKGTANISCEIGRLIEGLCF